MRKENWWFKKCLVCCGSGEHSFVDSHGQEQVHNCGTCNGEGVVNSEELIALIEALRDNGFVVEKRLDKFGSKQ